MILTAATTAFFEPAWSQDGIRIVFTTIVDNQKQVSTALTDGPGEFVLTQNGGNNTMPALPPIPGLVVTPTPTPADSDIGNAQSDLGNWRLVV